MEFEWDGVKDRENLRKHDVRFETAKLVFDDPLAVTYRADSDGRGGALDHDRVSWFGLSILCGLDLARRNHAADLRANCESQGEEGI